MKSKTIVLVNKSGIPIPEKYEELIKGFAVDENVDYSHIKVKMSKSVAFLRSKEECTDLLDEINEILTDYPLKHKSLSAYFYDKDMLLSAKALLETVLGEMPLTGSRGGAVFVENGDVIKENILYRKYLTVTADGKVSFEQTRPVPEKNEPFEKYLSKI